MEHRSLTALVALSALLIALVVLGLSRDGRADVPLEGGGRQQPLDAVDIARLASRQPAEGATAVVLAFIADLQAGRTRRAYSRLSRAERASVDERTFDARIAGSSFSLSVDPVVLHAAALGPSARVSLLLRRNRVPSTSDQVVAFDLQRSRSGWSIGRRTSR